MTASLPTTMRANVLLEAQSLRMEERPVPVPGAGEVLVQVHSVGICGSDMHFYSHGRAGHFVVESPIVLGHECGGTIVAVGEGVQEERVGERVAIEPQRPNLESRESLTGNYNLDPDVEFYAAPPVDGSFQEYVTIPSTFAHAIPDSLSDDGAALIEPLSVALQGARKAQITAGDRVLISGAGPIGIMLTQVALTMGATEVFVSDIDESRRTRALEFGATGVIDAREDVATLGLDVDAYIDASGAHAAVVAGIMNVRPAGRIVLVGLGATEMTLPVVHMMNLELTLTGTYRYANTYPRAIALAASGRIDIDRFATGTFGLDELDRAFQASGDPASLKVMVKPGE
ncbi:MAG: NAD(P)-dependent alcohol dehydrogenase [Leucobacter sp.]